MKIALKFLVLFSVISTLFTSCRTEETEFIQAEEEQVLKPNSLVAGLMQRTAMNDGSNDNIIDSSNCFNIVFPVTVFANGIEITVNTEDDLNDIEAVFDEFDDDDDLIVIQFPITVILVDFTEVVVNNISEFNALSSNCNGENEIDDDIECIDFRYPITATIFNSSNEVIETIIINNDNDLYDFIDDIDENDIINIDFPITVILFDGTTLVVNDLNELENTIEIHQNDCDEDDDFDWNDDDCDNCTDTQLIDILTSCTNWMVDKLERSDNDLEDIYVGYLFNFLNNGIISVTSSGNMVTGTWEATGSANSITVIIDIPTLPDFNNSWNLHEISQTTGETKADLRLGDDRLRFESDCISGGGSVDDTALVQALTNGDWFITYFFDDTDETAAFSDYVFNFASDGSSTATNTNGATIGSWSTSLGDETPLELNLNFGVTIPLDELAEDWDVLEVTNDIIRLKDVSGSDGSIDFLTFERTQGGGGGNDLASILADGLWIVGSYTDDGIDETADYNGYQINFDANGTVVADNGTTINGTWAVQSFGNILVLDFDNSIPFDEFNDDWDVISVTDTQVIVQDVSGGNGGTDILIFEKN